jgi:hypothetical protein
VDKKGEEVRKQGQVKCIKGSRGHLLVEGSGTMGTQKITAGKPKQNIKKKKVLVKRRHFSGCR